MDVITTNLATQDNSSKTQRSRILRLLIAARGSWVPLPEIMACAAQYNARIFELRKKFNIENRTETIDGQRHSWFRLIPSGTPKSAPPAPAPRTEIPWKDRQPVTGLPLWDLGVRQ